MRCGGGLAELRRKSSGQRRVHEWRCIAGGAAVSLLAAAAVWPATVFAGAGTTGAPQHQCGAGDAGGAGVTRTRSPIQIGPQDTILKNSFVRIRGLPAAAALSEGHAIGPGALGGAAGRAGEPRRDRAGRIAGAAWDVVIGLVTIDGTVLTESKTVARHSRPRPAHRAGRTTERGADAVDQVSPRSPAASGSAAGRVPRQAQRSATRALRPPCQGAGAARTRQRLRRRACSSSAPPRRAWRRERSRPAARSIPSSSAS